MREMLLLAELFLLSRNWRHEVPKKYLHPYTKVYGVASQRILIEMTDLEVRASLKTSLLPIYETFLLPWMEKFGKKMCESAYIMTNFSVPSEMHC
jgi:hypothetical protein